MDFTTCVCSTFLSVFGAIITSGSAMPTLFPFSDAMVDVTSSYSGSTESDTTMTTGQDRTTAADSSEDSGSEEALAPWIIGVGAVGGVVVIGLAVVITLLIVRFCCNKNLKLCPSKCCSCCCKPEPPPPMLPDKTELDVRQLSILANKDKENGDDTAISSQFYINEEMAKTKGRAKANTYMDEHNQEIYTNVLEHDVLSASDDLLEEQQDLYVNEEDEEGTQIKEIARKATVKAAIERETHVTHNTPVGVQQVAAGALCVNDVVVGVEEDDQEMYVNADALQEQVREYNDNSADPDQQETYTNLQDVTPDTKAPSDGGAVKRLSHSSTGSRESAKQKRIAAAQSGAYGNQVAVDTHYSLLEIDAGDSESVAPVLRAYAKAVAKPSISSQVAKAKPPKPSNKPTIPKTKPTFKPKVVVPAEPIVDYEDDVYVLPDSATTYDRPTPVNQTINKPGSSGITPAGYKPKAKQTGLEQKSPRAGATNNGFERDSKDGEGDSPLYANVLELTQAVKR